MFRLNNMDVKETGGVFILKSLQVDVWILMESAPEFLQKYKVRPCDLSVEK